MTEIQKALAIRLLESTLSTVKSDEPDEASPQTSLHGAMAGDGIKASITIRFERIVH